MLPKGVSLIDELREKARVDLEASQKLEAFEAVVSKFNLSPQDSDVVWRFILVTEGYDFDQGVEPQFKNLKEMVLEYRRNMRVPDKTNPEHPG
jgi:hypothetical protein